MSKILTAHLIQYFFIMKSFAILFKKYRLRAEFATYAELGLALAEKGLIYEDSIFSHWQKGTRIPTNRYLILTVLEIFIAREGVKTIYEANQFLASTGLGNLTEEEIQKLFKKKVSEPLHTQGNKLFEQLNKLIFFILAILGSVFFLIYAFIDLKNTLVFFAFCINFFLSVSLYMRVNKNLPMLRFLNVIAFAFSAWCLATLFWRAALPSDALLATKLLYFAPIAAPTAFLLFGLSFPNKKVKKSIIFFLAGCSILLASLTLVKNAVIVSVITPQVGEKSIVFGWAYYSLYLFYYPIFFVFGYVIFIKKFLKAKGEQKMQLFCILIGAIPATITGMVACLIFGTLGNFHYKWLGALFSVFWIGGIYFAIAKYHLLSLHPVFKKFFFDFSQSIKLQYFQYKRKNISKDV